MKDFLKYLFGFYWNDPDSRASGYRSSLAFSWAFILFGIVLPVVKVVCK